MNTKKFTDYEFTEIQKMDKNLWKRIWKNSYGKRLPPKILDIKAENAYSDFQKMLTMTN
jgi:hypothetical protein